MLLMQDAISIKHGVTRDSKRIKVVENIQAAWDNCYPIYSPYSQLWYVWNTNPTILQ
jgi:hypothetical protein